MIKIPRVALFEPEDNDASGVLSLFKRHEYSLRVVNRPEQVVQSMQEEDAEFDTIVVPLRLKGGGSGVSTCLQIKSVHSLASVPIIGLSYTQDKPIIQGFYEMGADVVVTQPFDADLLYFLIGSLARQRRLFLELTSDIEKEAAFTPNALLPLESLGEALVLLDTHGGVSFVNLRARILLGLSNTPTPEELEAVKAQLEPFKEQLQQNSDESTVLRFEQPLRRSDGAVFDSRIEVSALIGSRHEVTGFMVKLADPAQLRQIASMLLNSYRTKALCLFSAAASIRLAEMAQQAGVSPLAGIEKMLLASPMECALESSLTRILEFLDLAISPSIAVRVKVKNVNLALRSNDFMELVGHMILHCAEFIGTNGEMLIESSDNVPGEGVSIVIAASTTRPQPLLDDEALSELISGHFWNVLDNATQPEKIAFGLEAGQRLAEKYRSKIEYRLPSESTLKLRVKLPPVREQAKE